MKYMLIQLTSALLIAGAILGGFLIVKSAIEKPNKAEIYQACASTNQVQYDDGKGSLITTPIEDKVSECMELLK
jgi:hypothetical protein